MLKVKRLKNTIMQKVIISILMKKNTIMQKVIMSILLKKKVGDPIESGETLAILYSDSEEKLANGLKEAGSAYTYAAEAPKRPVLIKEIIE